MRPRVRVHLTGLTEGERELDPAASRYLVRVHRLLEGAEFLAFDPENAREGVAVLVSADPRRARCRVQELGPAANVAPLDVVLVQALGKGEKPDRVVRDATALGARGVIFVASERSVPRVAERGESRGVRWQTIAREAARQSGRGDVPFLVPPVPLQEALSRAELEPCRQRIVLSPEAATPLFDAVDASGTVALLIGPEGGLSDDELAAAESAGFRRASFGALVLRTETAATAALGALLGLSASRRSSKK